MKKRTLSEGVPLKASLLLLGIFLVFTIAFHPTMVAAQMTTVSCQELRTECERQCNGFYSAKDKETLRENTACLRGCRFYWEFCLEHKGEVIKASIQGEIFLAEATLRVFEKMLDKEN
jgi:hypothetical protein